MAKELNEETGFKISINSDSLIKKVADQILKIIKEN